MNLQESIRRILREETKIPIELRRRSYHIDESFIYFLRKWAPNFCDFENGQKLMDKLIYDTLKDLYFGFFNDYDINSIEWKESSKQIEEYLIKKYKEKIINIYQLDCKG